jgi:hypothetical protein
MSDKTFIGGIATIGYDNGTNEPDVGDILTGADGAFGELISLTQAGAWDGSATGILTLRAISGTYVEDEVITNTTQSETMADIDDAGSAFSDKSGDFDTADNWSPSGVPATADDVFFNGLAETVPADWTGSDKQLSNRKFSVDDGFDQSAKNFASITISSDYDGNIGDGLDPDTGVYNGLRCACDGVVFSGTGNVHIIAQHASLPIDNVANSSQSGTIFLAKGFTNGQEITKVTNSGSKVVIVGASGTTLAAPEVDEVVCTTRTGSVTIAEDNSSATLKVTAVLGTVTAFCNIADAQVAGGTLSFGDDDFEPASARTITLLNIFQGNFLWNIAGTVSECYCFAGKFKISGSGSKIIGDSSKNNGTVEIHNANVELSNASNNFNQASGSEFKIFGSGTLNLPRNTDITFS